MYTNIDYNSTGGSFTNHNMTTNAQIDMGYSNLTSTMVDNILVDLATANKDGYRVTLTGNNAPPSAVGNNAITTLTTAPLSWSIYVDN